jgi:DmsE family decaheme c-type cytochrome
MKRKYIVFILLPLSLLLLSFSLAMGETTGTKSAGGQVGYVGTSYTTDTKEPEGQKGPAEPDSTTNIQAEEGQMDFVGAETCGDCHEEQYASYAKSVHFNESIKGPQAQDACETCHGAGGIHVENEGGSDSIFTFYADTDPQAKSAKCLTCHQRTPGMDLWDMGAHKRNDVSCDSCHDLHVGGRQKPNEPEVCFGCHREVKIQANKRSHHPILEGKVSCSSCHEPHGSLNRGMVKSDDSQQLCFKCHADKRGPVVWEHAPVEEDCQSCHTVHGSNHTTLLNERIPQLCQNCHDWSRHPGTPYDNATSFTSRWDCLRCHAAIHGSNSPSGSGLRYTR